MAVLITACDHGLEPPTDRGAGAIEGSVHYVGDWPPSDELQDLRFVAMRFIPQDTTDFFRLNDMEISVGLSSNVSDDVFSIALAQAGTYFYSGIAQKFDEDLLSWRPIGLYADNGGIFVVRSGETVSISITVDFDNLPVFPPR